MLQIKQKYLLHHVYACTTQHTLSSYFVAERGRRRRAGIRVNIFAAPQP